MFRKLLLLPALILLALFGSDCLAGRPLIMVTEHWPPFRINDPQSPSGFTGIDIDLTLSLARQLGESIAIERRPWARALEMMRHGQADLITGIARTPEREEYLHYLGASYVKVQPVFYAGRGRGHLIRSYRDLYANSIGYSLHSAYFEPFDSDQQLHKVGLATEAQILQMLALGRVDLAVGTDPNISGDITRLGLQAEVEPTLYQPAVTTELYIAVSRKSPLMARARELDQALNLLLANGRVEAILGNYR